MSSSYRLELDRWLAGLDVKAETVLDVGGSQLPIKGRTKSWDVGEYLIADLPEPHVGSPAPDIELDLNSFDEGVSTGDTYYKYFDVVFCLETFDYVWNTYFAFESIRSFLKPGGTAWITFPSVYPLNQPIEDDALRYMPAGIKKLAEAAHFSIEEMIPRVAETYSFNDFCRIERLRAAKGQDHRIVGWIVKFVKS